MIGNDMKQAPINIVIYSTTKVADDLFGGILTKLILSMFCWRSLRSLKNPSELVSQEGLQITAQRQENFTRLSMFSMWHHLAIA